jgi:hypothetical protein
LGWGGGCLFTFFTFVHILLLALFFVSFLIYFDETDSKQQKNPKETPYQPMILKIQRKQSAKQKSQDFCQNVCDFQKENHTLRCGFKNL